MKHTLESVFSLAHRRVIVTGAARGIGQTIAEMAAGCGAAVVVADRDESGGRRVAEALAAEGCTARFVHVDITQEASIDRAFNESEQLLGGPVDVLVNNAAMIGMWPFTDMPVEAWDAMQSVNVRGTYLCMRQAIQRLRKASLPGRIINVSSMASIHPSMHGAAAYCASKGAVNAMTRSAALDCAKDNILINAVLPNAIGHEHQTAQFHEHHLPIPTGPSAAPNRIPMDRQGETRELAAMVTFLAGPGASYITGQTFVVDGGFLLA
jgi:gluconate 5-dehydrogenase/2-deoxy-D-gluconate 3-dehydrogenase